MGLTLAGRAATGFEQVEETRFLLNQPFPNGASLKRLTFFLTDVRRPASRPSVTPLPQEPSDWQSKSR